MGSVSATIFTAFGNPKQKNRSFPKKRHQSQAMPILFRKKRKNMSTKRGKSSVKQMIMGAGKTSVVSPLLLGPYVFCGRPTQDSKGILNAIFCRDLFQASGWFLCIQRFPCQLPGETIGVVNMASIFLVQNRFGEYDCCQKTLGTPNNNTNLPTNHSPKLLKTKHNFNPHKTPTCQDCTKVSLDACQW